MYRRYFTPGNASNGYTIGGRRGARREGTERGQESGGKTGNLNAG